MRIGKTALACAAAILLPALSAAAQPKPTKTFSDKAIDEAVKKGVAFLFTTQQADGSWDFKGEQKYPTGMTALVTLALLEAGVNPQDERLVKALDFMEKTPDTTTYSLGLRASVWEKVYRITPRDKYKKLMEKDVNTLVGATKDGSYNYFCNEPKKSTGDHSNSQYGVLGVWAGARGNMEIPSDYWGLVMKHWIGKQHGDGGWGYNHDDAQTTPTMATAGLATLFVCYDNLLTDAFIKCDQKELEGGLAPIMKGLGWFEKNFEKSLGGGLGYGHGDLPYYLYGVERVGLACGYKYFGQADWYKLSTQKLLSTQAGNGSWNGKWGPDQGTSYCLLFLVRGQHAVLFNKLERTGDWNNRPRDLASLTRWITDTFETAVNWQIINLKVPPDQWHDAPILYIAGFKKPEFSSDEIARLREYVYQGGVIFSVTECSGAGFRDGMREVYKQLFPDYELTPAGPNHPIYGTHLPLKGKPKFHVLSNGVRALAIHCDDDLPLSWQMQQMTTQKADFEGAFNVYYYVTDKGTIAHRGARSWPLEPQVQPARTVKLARLKYGAIHNPEPLAMQRLSRLMLAETATKVEVIEDVDITKLSEVAPQVAHLTGPGAFRLATEEKAALKAFVEAGGTLVLDAAGGSSKFNDSAQTLCRELFGANALKRLSVGSSLYNPQIEGVKDVKIETVKYRRVTKSKLGTSEPVLQAYVLDGRPAVIVSPQDLTLGLVGCQAWAVDGYDPGSGDEDPGSAYRIMRNVILTAAGNKTAAQPASQPASAPASNPSN
jgi:hypothetical protein